jgi:hypothetical protein
LIPKRTSRAESLSGVVAVGLFALLAHKTAPVGLFALLDSKTHLTGGIALRQTLCKAL